jgi:hypothetical protein
MPQHCDEAVACPGSPPAAAASMASQPATSSRLLRLIARLREDRGDDYSYHDNLEATPEGARRCVAQQAAQTALERPSYMCCEILAQCMLTRGPAPFEGGYRTASGRRRKSP